MSVLETAKSAIQTLTDVWLRLSIDERKLAYERILLDLMDLEEQSPQEDIFIKAHQAFMAGKWEKR